MTAAGTKGDTAIFAHKDGHEIHVKKSALSPKMKADLEALVKTKMAKGGEVKQSNPKLEESKKLPPMADGGDVADSIPINLQNPEVNPPSQDVPPPQDPGEQPYGTVPGQNLLEQPLAGVGQAPQVAPPALPPVQHVAETAQAAQLSDAPPEPSGPAQMPQTKAPEQAGLGAVSQGVAGGIQEQRQGIEQEAKAKSQAAEGTANALAAGQINKDMADSHYQEQLSSLEQERQALNHDIQNQHIKPDQYISDMSVPGKLMTGIGLILGGIGGGLTGQENPAMKFLQAQIDRNIHAQTAELGKKENLLSANMRQFGNIQQARDFTRVQNNDMIKNMIDQAAAKAGTPMAQAEALKAKGQLDQQSGMLMAKLGAMNTINSPKAGQGDISSALQTLRFTDPEQAKEIEGRLVPGVGIGNVPVPSDIRSKILAHQQLDERAKDLYKWASDHTGSLNPKDIAVGKEKALALQSLYREGTLGTVYKAGEQPLLDKVVGSDPTSFFNSMSNLPKLKEVVESNGALFGKLKNQYGIRPLAGQQQQEAPKARFTPNFKPRQ